LDEQKAVVEKGASMRLGTYPCQLTEGSLTRKLYGQDEIGERHRHRFEFNSNYREQMEEAGLLIAGISPDGTLAEIIEIPDHPFFVAVQFHPEFLSKPTKPHPLFSGFIGTALEHMLAPQRDLELSKSTAVPAQTI